MVCGDIIQLQAGSTYTGHFTMPVLTCPLTTWVTVETSGIASIPAYGTRINPSYAGVASLTGRPAFVCPGGPCANVNVMAKIITPNTNPPIVYPNNMQGFRFIGLEITRTSGTGFVNSLADVVIPSGVNHVIWDRCWVHGDDLDETKEFANFDRASFFALVNSYASQFQCVSDFGACTDAHVSGGGDNSNSADTDHAWKVVNNFLESSGEKILLGGGPGNTTPADIEIRLNHPFTPLTWDPLDPSYNGGVVIGAHPAKPVIVKNHYEMKNANRVLMEGNYLENVWSGFDENGPAIVLTPKTQSPGNLCPLCFVTNVTVRLNWIKTALEFGEMANVQSDAGFYAAAGNSYSVHDDVAENLGAFNVDQGCNNAGSGLEAYSGASPPSSSMYIHDVLVNHITLIFATQPTSTCPTKTHPKTGMSFDGEVGPKQFNINWKNLISNCGATCPVIPIFGGGFGCAPGNTTFQGQFNSCYQTANSSFQFNAII